MTKVVSVGKDGTENFVDGSITSTGDKAVNSGSVVIVTDGADAAGAFVGEASTAGIQTIQLTSALDATDTKLRRFFWTDKAKDSEGVLHDILDQSVAGYVLNHQANLDLGYLGLGTLIERRAEAHQPVWVRLLGKHSKQKTADRFSREGHMEGVQLSYNFNKYSNDAFTAYSTAFLTYAKAKTDFEDKFRAQNGVVVADKATGNAKTTSLGVGLAHTVTPTAAFI